MNWEAIGAIAETIGAAGVIASFVYLGIQIRSSTRAAQAAAYQQTLTGGRDILLALTSNADLFATIVRRRGLTDQEEIDKTREGFYFLANLHNWESQMYQYDQGMLEDRMWEIHWARIRSFVVHDSNFSNWWSKAADQSQFTPRLRSLIDELIASIARAV